MPMPIATIRLSAKDTVRPHTHTHITAPASSADKRFTTGLTEQKTTETARGGAERAHNAVRIPMLAGPARMWEPVPVELLFPHLGTAFTVIRGRRQSTRTTIIEIALAVEVTFIQAVTAQKTMETARGGAERARNAEIMSTRVNPARPEGPASAERQHLPWDIIFTG